MATPKDPLSRDLSSSSLLDEPVKVAPEQPKTLVQKAVGVKEAYLDFATTEKDEDSFGKRVGRDAALLAYAIPVGVGKMAYDVVSDPFREGNQTLGVAKDMALGVVDTIKNLTKKEYYVKHPLLAAFDVASVYAPVAGGLKATAIKAGVRTVTEATVKEALSRGVSEATIKTVFKKGLLDEAVKDAVRVGDSRIVGETVRNSFVKAGVDLDTATFLGNKMSTELVDTTSLASTKLKILDKVEHPISTTFGAVKTITNPLRTALFGKDAETAVGRIFGQDTVKKDPEGFLDMEKWAEAHVLERGIPNTIDNRQRMMQEWSETNPEWSTLTPEQKVSHFREYAKADLTRKELADQTGADVVLTKVLREKDVNAIIDTIKSIPETDSRGIPIGVDTIIATLEDVYKKDITLNMDSIKKGLLNDGSRQSLIRTISKLGDSKAAISFAKLSKEAEDLADSLQASGYRIGFSPKNKDVSQVTDVIAKKDGVTMDNLEVRRTVIGRWIDRLGFSPTGLPEGAPEYFFREGFTQNLMKELEGTTGGVIKVDTNGMMGKASIPLDKFFDWMDANRTAFQEARGSFSLPIRTVFDVKKKDLVEAGVDEKIAAKIEEISKRSLADIPMEVVGMADKLINLMRTRNSKFGGWMSNVYDTYLRVAYKGRYDLSPFFAAQQYLETQIQTAMFLKDFSYVSTKQASQAVNAVKTMGDWTAEKLGMKVKETSTYLRKIIADPSIEEISAIKGEILTPINKTVLEYTSGVPNQLGDRLFSGDKIQGIKEKAEFQKSIASQNFWYHVAGVSTVKQATNFNKSLAEKYGMTLKEALNYKMEGGKKVYDNPQLVEIMKDATQSVFHYQPGLLTSPLMKTLNVVWFPMRFQTKALDMTAKWVNSLDPSTRFLVMNNMSQFAAWTATDEGEKWRKTNQNMFYNILAYSTAYEQIGNSVDAVTKGRLFGGNTGLIGGVPFGLVVNIARELAILPSDPDQFDPKTGKRFTKAIPKKIVSEAGLAKALEQMLIFIMPSTPFYSLTGGAISGVSASKLVVPLVEQVVGASSLYLRGKKVDNTRKVVERQSKRVPLDYRKKFPWEN